MAGLLSHYMITDYLKDIAHTTAQGDAREESYYQYLSKVLYAFAKANEKKNIDVTTLPKKTEAGNPDFRVWDGLQQIIGYIEAKRPGENLDVIETSAQLKRYLNTFPNVILTDFYEFRLYRNGQQIDKVSIGRPFIAKKLKTAPPVENEEKFLALLEKFFSFSFPKVFTAETLAAELAKRTAFLRDEVITAELKEEETGKGKIFGFYSAFKQYLVANLSHEDFADIYSQTIAYGMFAARTRANGSFSRIVAYNLIPQTIGILRDVFHFISLGEPPLQMKVMIDDIADVLQAADVKKILDEYYRKGKGEDPIVHFYETFLNIYDPGTRERRGVYYTPEPVVKYIVRAIHELLKTHFDIHDGLAGKEVTLLDPAAGTLTFPAEAIKLAVKEYTDKYGDGGKGKFIKRHILNNYYAFELMMAPYAIGHIKISFLLEELGYRMQDDDRFKLYLTNTLDMEDLAQTQIPGLESLSEESHQAGRVKKNEPILVILGNPPYSGHSANKNEWTEKLMKEDLDGAKIYFKVDGEPLGEKNPKWLQDDYVKFLRFAQWKIHKAGKGIVGMITNHSYLDNATFRGMRRSLMDTFDEIYIIDLHGNGLKKETTPDGSKDENVFDIRQGTAIAIMVKIPSSKKKIACKVYHIDKFGLREEKYEWLEKRNFNTEDYSILQPSSPAYFFIKRNTEAIKHYELWLKINDIFPVNSVGVVTARDEFAIAYNKETLEGKIRQFRNLTLDKDLLQTAYNISATQSWDLDKARKDLGSDKNYDEYYQEFLYRPFDKRFIYYSPAIIERMRYEVMQHLLKNNIGLAIGRQGQVVGSEHLWNLAFVSENIVDLNLFYRGGELLFPLYLYPQENTKKKNYSAMLLFEPESAYGKSSKQPNIAAKITDGLEEAYNIKFQIEAQGKKEQDYEAILYYCYAVLYSPVYREKYAEFLKIDFPRIPFTNDYGLFQQLVEMGKELTSLHLLKHNWLNNPTVKYRSIGKDGNDKIGKLLYDATAQRVYINESRYFENVTPEVWSYLIGGYKVMEKYLKDRKGREMDDPGHYCRMAAAIERTIQLQLQIDELYLKAEKEVITFN